MQVLRNGIRKKDTYQMGKDMCVRTDGTKMSISFSVNREGLKCVN